MFLRCSVSNAGYIYHIPYHTIPYHTIPYHTIPYHTIPYLIIPYTIPYLIHIPYHTISNHTMYHTIPYHIISYHIPYHTISNHTIYHTIPYYIKSFHSIPFHSILHTQTNKVTRCYPYNFSFRKHSLCLKISWFQWQQHLYKYDEALQDLKSRD